MFMHVMWLVYPYTCIQDQACGCINMYARAHLYHTQVHQPNIITECCQSLLEFPMWTVPQQWKLSGDFYRSNLVWLSVFILHILPLKCMVKNSFLFQLKTHKGYACMSLKYLAVSIWGFVFQVVYNYGSLLFMMIV